MDKAILSVSPAPLAAVEISPRPRPAAADMGMVMRAARMAMTAEPVFASAEEPVADGRSYRALDGQSYARPDLRLGERQGSLPGPDVMFLRELDGATYLHIGLVQSLPEGALPLGSPVGPPRIDWNGGSLPLPEPTPVDGGGLRILARLTPDDVARLVAAMTDAHAGAVLVIDHVASYLLRTTADTNPHGPRPRRPWQRLPRLPPVLIEHPRPNPGEVVALPTDLSGVTGTLAMPPGQLSGLLVAAEHSPRVAVAPVRLGDGAFVSASAVIAPELIERWRDRRLIDIPELTLPPDSSSERRVETRFSRRLAFFFDRSLDQHAAIFRAIAGRAELPGEWQDSEWGTLCPAEFVNTVYLLPHEFRLSYDGARGLPHMLPVQYQASDGSRRIRVILRAEPWFDTTRVAGLQAALSRQTGGAYLHPQVIGGGIQSARLQLLTIFPEDIALDGAGDGLAVDVTTPFDLTLDLSEEYYALLVTILTGPVGLNGWVEAVLTPASGDRPASSRRIPLSLSFQRLGALPLERRVASAAINPDRVEITNRAAQPVTLAQAQAALLLLDANALLPANVLAAQPAESLPITLAPGAQAGLTFAPVSAPEGAIWNAVVPVLAGLAVDLDPDVALRAIHALAPAGGAGWQLRIISPQLAAAAAAPAPDQPIAVEVQMARPGRAPVQATLMAGTPERSLTFPRNLDDLTGAADPQADGFLRLSVRARGVWADGFGPWSTEAEHVGDTLFVFVPPKDGGGT